MIYQTLPASGHPLDGFRATPECSFRPLLRPQPSSKSSLQTPKGPAGGAHLFRENLATHHRKHDLITIISCCISSRDPRGPAQQRAPQSTLLAAIFGNPRSISPGGRAKNFCPPNDIDRERLLSCRRASNAFDRAYMMPNLCKQISGPEKSRELGFNWRKS